MRWVGCRPNRSLDPPQRHRASKSGCGGFAYRKGCFGAVQMSEVEECLIADPPISQAFFKFFI
jgi:hypothetical protein